METLERFFNFLEEIGIHIALIISGTFGALLSMGNKKELNWWQKILTILSGGSIANYLTPVVASWVNIGDSTRYGFGFLLGFSGLEGVKWIILKLKDKYGNNEK